MSVFCVNLQSNSIYYYYEIMILKKILVFSFRNYKYVEFKTNYTMIDSITQLVHTMKIFVYRKKEKYQKNTNTLLCIFINF